jgi:hypothetical protein
MFCFLRPKLSLYLPTNYILSDFRLFQPLKKVMTVQEKVFPFYPTQHSPEFMFCSCMASRFFGVGKRQDEETH